MALQTTSEGTLGLDVSIPTTPKLSDRLPAWLITAKDGFNTSRERLKTYRAQNTVNIITAVSADRSAKLKEAHTIRRKALEIGLGAASLFGAWYISTRWMIELETNSDDSSENDSEEPPGSF